MEYQKIVKFSKKPQQNNSKAVRKLETRMIKKHLRKIYISKTITKHYW